MGETPDYKRTCCKGVHTHARFVSLSLSYFQIGLYSLWKILPLIFHFDTMPLPMFILMALLRNYTARRAGSHMINEQRNQELVLEVRHRPYWPCDWDNLISTVYLNYPPCEDYEQTMARKNI